MKLETRYVVIHHLACRFMLAVLLAACAPASPDSDPPPRADNARQVEVVDCADPAAAAAGARCGTLMVPEDRETPAGRRMPLAVVVLPATGARVAADPVFLLAGGPGGAATAFVHAASEPFVAEVRTERDFVLVDRRGTGGSHPLECDLYGDGSDLQAYLGDFLPPDRVRGCREALEPVADLRLYATPQFVADLEAVRSALGYEQITFFGISYGTREALEYIRRHEERVRGAVLHGVVPPGFTMPLSYPVDTQRALDRVLAACAADANCRTAFPDLRADFHTLVARLDRGPVTVEVRHPETGAPTTVRFRREAFAETVRYLLYGTADANFIPLYVQTARRGDFAPLVQAAIRIRKAMSGGDGAFLSATCTQDVPFIDPAEAARLGQRTLLGDYRYRQQEAACRLWPRGDLPEDFHSPVRADVPVLLLSGDLDPTTPPRHAEDVARQLPNAVHVVIPHAAHDLSGLEGVECVGRLIVDFVAAGSAGEVDTSCLRRIARQPFVTKLPE